MKKILTIIMMMFVLATAAFAKEYIYDSSTDWPNTNPEVVETMPAVKQMAEQYLGLKEMHFKSADTLNPSFMFISDKVRAWAIDWVAKHPGVNQIIWYEDELNLYILTFFKEGKYIGMFIAAIDYDTSK